MMAASESMLKYESSEHGLPTSRPAVTWQSIVISVFSSPIRCRNEHTLPAYHLDCHWLQISPEWLNLLQHHPMLGTYVAPRVSRLESPQPRSKHDAN
jgi:hypothetical protein